MVAKKKTGIPMQRAQAIKPNFLIVGAAKSGTTSLYEYLRQHPEVFMPDWKEPAFFAPPEAGGITTEEEYLRLFEKATGKKVVGEASVAYLYDEKAPEKIRDFLGSDVKIIIILRNPVNMAYSLWGHQVREGFEDLSFKEALAAEEERMRNEDFGRERHSWNYDFAYKARADYMPQIERYNALFPREQMRIYIFEEFFVSGLPLLADLCRFLEIDYTFKPAHEGQYNAAGRIRSGSLRTILRERAAWKEPLKKIMPLKFRQTIRSLLELYNRVQEPLPAMSPEIEMSLRKTFDVSVRRLEDYIGFSLKKVWF